MICRRDGCNNEVPPQTTGRPRVFCSAECRVAHWNATLRKPSDTHKIIEFDATTQTGRCRKCGPVKVYVARDKYADGRPRRRLSCANRVIAGSAGSRRRYLRSRKRHAKRYGLSTEELDAIIIGQEGRCAICTTELRRMQVDHDHETKVVRGLLCTTCNTGLGKFGDDPARLRHAADYLDRYAGARHG